MGDLIKKLEELEIERIHYESYGCHLLAKAVIVDIKKLLEVIGDEYSRADQ